MFGFFKKENQASETYRMLKTEGDKYKRLLEDVTSIVNSGEKVFLLYFFDETGYELKRILETLQISYDDNKNQSYEHLVKLWKVSNLISGHEKPQGLLLASEFFPSRQENIKLLKWLGNTNSVTFYSELSNRYFEKMGMENVVRLMENLGMGNNEAIEHSLVNKSIIRCQEKVDDKVQIFHDAHNLEEWINLNLG